jgi:DNA-binding PadR family transcriptional regulator
MTSERPRKVYVLTTEGQNLLNFTEDSLNFICKKLNAPGLGKEGMVEYSAQRSVMGHLLKKIEPTKPLV